MRNHEWCVRQWSLYLPSDIASVCVGLPFLLKRRYAITRRFSVESGHLKYQRGQSALRGAARLVGPRTLLDIVCLHELKKPRASACRRGQLREVGYEATWHGEKSWNGVAISSKLGPLIETRRGLPGSEEDAALLRQVPEANDTVALATFVMHQRQHLCAIAPQARMLILRTLRFESEVREPDSIKIDAKATPAELLTAKTLVGQMSGNSTQPNSRTLITRTSSAASRKR